MGKYRAQYDVTLRFTAFVEVEGEFTGEDDPRIDKVADRKVRMMGTDSMAFDEEEYELLDVMPVSEEETS